MKNFVESKLREEQLTQSAFAKKIGVSQATINNILSGSESIRADTKYKIATTYSLDPRVFDNDKIVAEDRTGYFAGGGLSPKELRLLDAFKNLDERRQDRFLDTIEDMVLALRESGGRGSPEKDSADSNLKRNSNG
ncbi:MAG: helix-turn-helix domain-containing protein [Geobacteraceae bacterium]